MVYKNRFGSLLYKVSIISAYDNFSSAISKTFASRPIFRRLWASELEVKEYLSKPEICQFILGSDDKPVSIALMYFAWSPKASSILLKPDSDPNTPKCGVQACAGIITADDDASLTILTKS